MRKQNCEFQDGFLQNLRKYCYYVRSTFLEGNLKLVLIKVTKVKLVVRMTLIPLTDLDLRWVCNSNLKHFHCKL